MAFAENTCFAEITCNSSSIFVTFFDEIIGDIYHWALF